MRRFDTKYNDGFIGCGRLRARLQTAEVPQAVSSAMDAQTMRACMRFKKISECLSKDVANISGCWPHPMTSGNSSTVTGRRFESVRHDTDDSIQTA